MLRHAPELDLDINPYELLQYQEELDHIDSLAKNGKFYDERGGIPRGQAQIRLLIEQAYDMVNECLSYMEAKEEKHADPLELIQKMGERLLDAQDSLWTFTKASGDQLYSLSRSKLGIINRTLTDGADMIKRLLEEPKRGMNQAASKVAALSRSGLSVLTRLYAEFEPVDESLKPTKSRLDEIRSQLLDMRNSFNKTRSQGLLASQSRISTELQSRYGRELESMRSALDEIDRGRVDGQFIKSPGQPAKSGQDHLKSLLNECYCLVFEMQDRLSIE
jgi:hypothetical protein